MTGRRGGFVLVQALVAMACVIALVAMLAADQRVAMQAARGTLRSRRAELAAESGVAVAMAELASADTNHVSLADDWAALGDGTAEQFDLGDATFRVQVVDAGSGVDISVAAEDQLQRLPLDSVQIASILDWREPGAQPRTVGAKDDYYNALARPYNARLAAPQVLSELLLVRGWTARDLYTATAGMQQSSSALLDDEGAPMALASVLTVRSGAPNTRADGTSRVDLGQGRLDPGIFRQFDIGPGLAAQIAARSPFRSFAELLVTPGLSDLQTRRLLDGATFSTETRMKGRLNLNTASRAALLTLPEMTADVASAIVSRQSDGFASLGELVAVSGVSGALAARLADRTCVGSDTWIVRSYGRSGSVGCALEVAVRKDSDRVRVLSWERLPGWSPPGWWRWDRQASYTTAVVTP